MITQLLIIGLSIVLVYEDFQKRAINWFWLPILLGVLIFNIYPFDETELSHILTNEGIYIVMMGLLFLYTKVRYRGEKKLADEMLGWGDILYLPIVAIKFNPLTFVVFLNVLLLLTLIIYGLLTLTKRKPETIPLVGCLSIGVIFCELGEMLGIDSYHLIETL